MERKGKKGALYYIFHLGSPLLFSDSRISNMIWTAINKQAETTRRNERPCAVPKIFVSISVTPSRPTQNPTRLAIIIIKIFPTAPSPQTKR